MNVQVLYEDNHLIAINKPGGYLVQGDETGDIPLTEHVKEYIKLRYDKPGAVYLGVIHRLDRPVSGVLLYARTSKALTRMNDLFKNREVKKTYWAVTAEQPDPLEGSLTHFILKDRAKNKSKAYDRMSNRSKGAKKSNLNYKMIGGLGNHKLIEVNPITGRPHQIRVQLASIGCPIRGDIKYGFPEPNENGNIDLHCRSLEFIHPVKKELVRIWANPSKEEQIWQMFDSFWR